MSANHRGRYERLGSTEGVEPLGPTRLSLEEVDDDPTPNRLSPLLGNELGDVVLRLLGVPGSEVLRLDLDVAVRRLDVGEQTLLSPDRLDLLDDHADRDRPQGGGECHEHGQNDECHST